MRRSDNGMAACRENNGESATREQRARDRYRLITQVERNNGTADGRPERIAQVECANIHR